MPAWAYAGTAHSFKYPLLSQERVKLRTSNFILGTFIGSIRTKARNSRKFSEQPYIGRIFRTGAISCYITSMQVTKTYTPWASTGITLSPVLLSGKGKNGRVLCALSDPGISYALVVVALHTEGEQTERRSGKL